MDIYQGFVTTSKRFDMHTEYPSTPGMYAIFVQGGGSLGSYGSPGQIIYIGIAKDSLRKRDFDDHFTTGKTGRSTLRRSLGAVLKGELGLRAIPRGGPGDSNRFDCYRFTADGEQALTNWMINNLQIGYWVPPKAMPYAKLRLTEKQITIELHPTLDLDPRTRRHNPLAESLLELRRACKAEAERAS